MGKKIYVKDFMIWQLRQVLNLGKITFKKKKKKKKQKKRCYVFINKF